MEENIIFTEEEDEALINLVSQHGILYDLSEGDYKNQLKKDKVWNEIATILNKSGDRCRKRWKNIKDTYFRQKRKNKSGTASAAPKNPRSKFKKYAKLLSFLETVPREGLTISNVENDDDDYATQDTQMSDDFNESNFLHTQDQSENLTENGHKQSENLTGNCRTNTTQLTDTSPPNSQSSAIKLKFSKSTKRQKKSDILSYLSKGGESRQKMLDNISKNSVDEELSSFSDHVRCVLKNLPPILKIKAKKELYDVLTKYEFLSLESQYSPSQTISSSASSPYNNPYSPESILPEQPLQDKATSDPLAPISVQHSPAATSVQHYTDSANVNSTSKRVLPNYISHSSTDIHYYDVPISEVKSEIRHEK